LTHDAIPPDFYYECDMFLVNLMEMECTMALLPKESEFQCHVNSSTDQLISQWITHTLADLQHRIRSPSTSSSHQKPSTREGRSDSFTRIGSSYSAQSGQAHDSPKRRTHSQSNSLGADLFHDSTSQSTYAYRTEASTGLWRKGHLLLIVPLAMRLASCSHAALRATAAEIVGFVDLSAFVSSFREVRLL
jgi:hypothetical protein